MNFLASILPGVRHLRTPLAIGVIWVVGAVVLVAPKWAAILDGNRGLAALVDLAGEVPQTFAVAALSFSCYLLGVVLQELAGWLGRLASRILGDALGKALNALPYNQKPKFLLRALHGLRGLLNHITPDARGAVMALLARQYGKMHAPAGTSLMFPHEVIIEHLEPSSMQLGQSAPAQSQEYDRLSSEADFRGGVVPPLVFLLAVLAYQVSWWLAPVAIVLALILLGQTLTARQDAYTILAMSANQGYIKLPILDSLADEFARIATSMTTSSRAEWVGLTFLALQTFDEFDASTDVLIEYASFDGLTNKQEIDEILDFIGRHDIDLRQHAEHVLKPSTQ